jgi:hypothetical protein
MAIFEARIYTMHTGKVPEWEKGFAEAYVAREKYSKLYGMWHTDIGPLNQVIHIWQYDSLQQRADIRATAAKDPSGLWPPKGGDLIVSQEVDIIDPVKGFEPLQPGSGHSAWELRVYTYAGGQTGKAAAAFGESYAGRNGVYPVGLLGTTSYGQLNRLYQLFPYKSWEHREEVRKEFREKGVWPPHAEVSPVSQLVRLMIPADVSPLK